MAVILARLRTRGTPPAAPDVPAWLVPVMVGVAVIACFAACIAVVAAEGGMLLQLSVIGAALLATTVLLVRQRSLFVLLVLVVAIQVPFYKTFSEIDVQGSSGAAGIYITSVGVLLILLYVGWLMDGTLVRDLRERLGQPAFLVPIFAILTVLPSFVMAESKLFSTAELLRMAAMLALYVYVGARLRHRHELFAVIAVLLALAFFQLTVAALQWRTGSSLGLVALGHDTELIARIADNAEIPRPSGTLLHPVLLGALMAQVTLLGLSVGLGTDHGRTRLYCLAAAFSATCAIVLAQSRAALLSAAVVGLALFAWNVWKGRIGRHGVYVGLVVVVIGAAAFVGPIMERIASNFGTDQFSVEVRARTELNDIAFEIIRDAPLIGIGLNNFVQAEPRYDRYGLIFPGFPVHNLYLLVFAETGIVGLLGMGATALALISVSIALVKSGDLQLAPIGVAGLAMYAFYAMEEMTNFSLRQDVNLLAFWILAGLTVAALRIVREDSTAVLHGVRS